MANLEDEPSSDHEGRGYVEFGGVAKDLETLADVIWHFSLVAETVFPYDCACRVLVHAIFSIPSGAHIRTASQVGLGIVLTFTRSRYSDRRPSFWIRNRKSKVEHNGKGENERTCGKDKSSLVEVAGTDGIMVESASEVRSPAETEDESMTENSEAMEVLLDGGRERWKIEVAKVYERTIVELGVSLETFGADGSK